MEERRDGARCDAAAHPFKAQAGRFGNAPWVKCEFLLDTTQMTINQSYKKMKLNGNTIIIGMKLTFYFL